MKHTPGPWLQNGAAIYALQETGKYHKGEPILENRFYIFIQGPCSEEEKLANAKLIAAAPELLAACEWAVEQFKKLADDGKYPEHLLAQNGGSGYLPLVLAIKKATEI